MQSDRGSSTFMSYSHDNSTWITMKTHRPSSVKATPDLACIRYYVDFIELIALQDRARPAHQ
ncbi:hypothetical protein MSG28_007577 [Choristoneura fumiferana]|uniref:Uncharacterized protein n=1 Tax=Choristoneura fumiferana TaxID=7141 RepID=A0ACC0JXY1_CHOFU|nr:hypothetical protein MSG28_007577 [Choristoneura fumiferana]